MAPRTGYALVPKEVPARRRGSLYQVILEDFAASKERCVLVEETDKKPVTLVQGLRKAIASDGLTSVSVTQRGPKVFLVKED
jgi:hypothetical protein